MSFKRLFRTSTALLIALFFVGALPWRELRADANIHGDYNCDRLSVTYDQTSSWDLNTQGEFVITNTSEETVEGWTLQFEFAADLTITNLWNGQDLRNEITPANILIIGNEVYNGIIAPGESVSFGLIMTGYEFAPVAPLNATLPVTAEPVPEEIPAEPEVIPAVDSSTCVIFAGSDVTISGWRTTIEGNVYAGNSFNFQGSELSVAGTVSSEGTVTITGYSSVVSGIQEGAAHVDMLNLNEEILSRSNELTVLDRISDTPVNGYYYSEDNINVNAQTLEGEAVIVSEGDIEVNVDTISGENDITLYSVNGNITINCNQAVLNGTVYAPNGTVTLNTDEITVIGKILANELVFNGSALTVTDDLEDIPEITPEPTVTVEPTATVTPVPTEEPTATPTTTVTPTEAPTATPTPVEEEEPDPTPTPEPIDETLDSDEDGIPDYMEIEMGTNPNDPDSDGDGLDDYRELMVGYDPTSLDTDSNGILDGEEDLDSDGLCNVNELSLETDLLSEDTDGDRLKDGEELYTYGTDPKNPDSDGDGILDGDEIVIGKDPLDPSDATIRIEQTKIQEISNEENPAITSVEVTMSLADSIDRSLKIRDMYNVDVYTTDVVGRIGSPISFECAEDFDTATVVIHYSEAALGDIAESNLGILWYDEENGIFVEQEQAILDSSNNKITVELEHFSEYILVDMYQWRRNIPRAYNPEGLGCSTTRDGVDIYLSVDITNGMTNEEKVAMIEYMEEIIAMMQGDDTCYFSIFDRNSRSIFCNFEPYTSLTGVPSEVKSQIFDFHGMTQDVWLQLHNNAVLNTSVDLGHTFLSVSFASGTYHSWPVPPRTLVYVTNNPSYGYAVNLLTNNTQSMNSIRNILGGGIASFLDEDDDGLPDSLEVEGMYGLNGQVYYSDPEATDNDGDGLSDGEEMGTMYSILRVDEEHIQICVSHSQSDDVAYMEIVELGDSQYAFLGDYIPETTGEIYFVFDVVSDPGNTDSDDDSIIDSIDEHPFLYRGPINYIIYATSDSFMKDCADAYVRLYERDRKDCFCYEIDSSAKFVAFLGTLNRARYLPTNRVFNETEIKDGVDYPSVNNIVVITHGWNGSIFFNDDELIFTATADIVAGAGDYPGIPCDIDTIDFQVCHLGEKYDGTRGAEEYAGEISVADTFFLNSQHTVHNVYAWKGSTSYMLGSNNLALGLPPKYNIGDGYYHFTRDANGDIVGEFVGWCIPITTDY